MAADLAPFRMRPLLYVAGPYTRPDPVENTHRAARVATWIYENTRWVPMLPHITLAWHLITPRPVDFWYDLDLQHMLRCDAIVRLPGASTGADRELAVALEHGLEHVQYETFPEQVQDIWERNA